jgi:hypothetical protein
MKEEKVRGSRPGYFRRHTQVPLQATRLQSGSRKEKVRILGASLVDVVFSSFICYFKIIHKNKCMDRFN